ncbi:MULTISPECIES: TetR/AcrR family transcriptional regulator [Amycolatopsis]|uniref:DNA-binding transcriptional regulator, AcrR family n=2 Tax=Amycolatopsis TaxID=1813 RepID=A0A1I4DEJ9_9PSEU|nr:TetR/AcrR family transcriptional regulator [Amycolatopsis sacchari]SFK92224.1 DNA-binding transcriptional regulator, AcrR family [Amycolatopsis sacchari]
MTADWNDGPDPRLDPSEPDSRARVVAAATALLVRHGVSSLSSAHIQAAAGVSRAELEQLFPDPDAITEAIVSAQLDAVLQAQRPRLDAVQCLDDLEQWLFDPPTPAAGRALGSLIHLLADRHDRGHRALAKAFSQWKTLLASALSRLQATGELNRGADPEKLAIGLIAALQGGHLLAHLTQDADQLRATLAMAFDQVRAHAP